MRKNDNISPTWKLVIAIAICEATGIISGLISNAEMNTWFSTIKKPSWNPPSIIFGPVWGVLYLLMGIALWIIWKSEKPERKKANAILIFGLQLFFNFWWSILFFKFHSPILALLDIVIMIITILYTIFTFAEISRKSAWLLVPYISWVCFASVLNYTVWSLN